jgi:glycosyltransferase involved in cell wall biosynthesis
MRNLLSSRVPFVRRLTLWALNQFDEIVAVSDAVADAVAPFVSTRPHVIPAYLGRDETGGEQLGDDVLAFFSAATPTLVVAAYYPRLAANGTDVYGLDLAVEAFCRIAHDRPKLRLAGFAARGPKTRAERRHLSALEDRIKREGLADRCRFFFGAPLAPVFKLDTIFLRPSRADGDAVSVREALAAGVPTIASDVVVRPPGCALVPSDDAEALEAAIVSAASSSDRPRKQQSHVDASDTPLQKLLEVYDEALHR